MAESITRKCACCKEVITIEHNNLSNIVYFDKKYYHSNCFIEMATKKSSSNRGKPAYWQEALDNLWILESETKSMIEHVWAKDDLNDWLLQHYDIATVPSRFWQIIAELERGKYKGKKCKPITVETILGTWQWGQQKLNSIATYNKQMNKGPKDDNARLVYDLAILIQKIPLFLAHQEKQKATKEEMTKSVVFDDIDMSKIGQGKQTKRRDISDISDDIFIE